VGGDEVHEHDEELTSEKIPPHVVTLLGKLVAEVSVAVGPLDDSCGCLLQREDGDLRTLQESHDDVRDGEEEQQLNQDVDVTSFSFPVRISRDFFRVWNGFPVGIPVDDCEVRASAEDVVEDEIQGTNEDDDADEDSDTDSEIFPDIDQEIENEIDPNASHNTFHGEVFESLQRGLKEGIKVDNLVLEINGSKFAYDQRPGQVIQGVLTSILEIASSEVDSVDDKAMLLRETVVCLKKFKGVLENYIKSTSKIAQKDCLTKLEGFVLEKPHFLPIVAKIIQTLNDLEILSENAIFDWYEGLSEKEIKENKLLKKFIEWLEEDEDESESSSDDD